MSVPQQAQSSADGRRIPSSTEIQAVIDSAFARCAAEKNERLLHVLVPFNRELCAGRAVLPFLLDAEMDEASRLITMFSQLASSTAQGSVGVGASSDLNYVEFSVRCKLLVYCYIMEADYPFITLLNLLRVLADKEPCWVFHKRGPDDSIKEKNGKNLGCQYPWEKIHEIAEADKNLQTNIGSILEGLWWDQLRNAFSHSQYAIQNGSVVLTSWGTGVQMSNAHRQDPTVVAFQTLDSFYLGALTLWNCFLNNYRTSRKPFEDGRPYRIPLGLVRWDSDREVWTWK